MKFWEQVQKTSFFYSRLQAFSKIIKYRISTHPRVAYCKQYKKKFATFDSVSEQLHVISLLHNNNEYEKKFGSVWVAGNDIAREGVWKWAPENVPINIFLFWSTAQPDSGKNENCLELRAPYEYRLNDLDCRTKLTLLCQAQINRNDPKKKN